MYNIYIYKLYTNEFCLEHRSNFISIVVNKSYYYYEFGTTKDFSLNFTNLPCSSSVSVSAENERFLF